MNKTNNTSDQLQYDVVIVGSGVVGATLACILASQQKNSKKQMTIAVVEAHQFNDQWDDSEFDVRVSALTLASKNILSAVGAWPLMQQQRISPYQSMQVWDADGTGEIDFSAAEVNQSELGHIVENRVTLSALLETTQQYKNIEMICPAKVLGLESDDDWQTVVLDNQKKISARLVVAADGALSRMRELAGFELQQKEYNHHAVVTTVETELPHNKTAYQRFMPSGPLALLPLNKKNHPEQYCSIVWSTVPEQAERLLALSDQQFKTELAKAFENRLGAIKHVAERLSFPLLQRHAKSYVKPRVALIGDAAHTIHPLAGQGVNLGILDAAVLAEEISQAYQRHGDVGSLQSLQRYQRRRRGDNLLMMSSMQAFKQLFAEKALPVRWLRNAGMSLMNKLPMVKNHIVVRAIGMEGDLPQLAK